MTKKQNTNKNEIGSGNIFADLGLDNAEELNIRAALGVQVMKLLNKRNATQKENAEFLGLKQPEVSAIMCAKFGRFSQERLIGFLNRLNQRVTIEVSRHKKGQSYQQVRIAA
jgi:predicted XRE-type DNA-binding protein